MKIIVCVIVYNRYQNLERWLQCWEQSSYENAELIIIHNDNGESTKFKSLCDAANIKYVLRHNVGFDIGAFQDVCKERLAGFPNDWDYLLWSTDDTLPMSKDFITPFINKIQEPGIGIACMQISASVSPHVRTTGYMIGKELSKQITFPAEPIKTKQDCYYFEHRGGDKTFTNQVRKMGFSCESVAPNKTSPLWDSGYWKRLNRQDEHDELFSGKVKSNKVVFVCTIFNTYPQIISSLILQTYTNWELILIHDGPTDNHGIREQAAQDSRIRFIETKERAGNWGHPLRAWALKEFDLGKYLIITNADNYYTPVFIEYMLKGFEKHTAVASFCSEMTHSYKAWQTIPCKLERGYLDCGGVMVRSDIAKEVGWRDIDSHSSDFTYFADIADRYSWSNFIPVKGNLFVHN